jgi:hypothetical protein
MRPAFSCIFFVNLSGFIMYCFMCRVGGACLRGLFPRSTYTQIFSSFVRRGGVVWLFFFSNV